MVRTFTASAQEFAPAIRRALPRRQIRPRPIVRSKSYFPASFFPRRVAWAKRPGCGGRDGEAGNGGRRTRVMGTRGTKWEGERRGGSPAALPSPPAWRRFPDGRFRARSPFSLHLEPGASVWNFQETRMRCINYEARESSAAGARIHEPPISGLKSWRRKPSIALRRIPPPVCVPYERG